MEMCESCAAEVIKDVCYTCLLHIGYSPSLNPKAAGKDKEKYNFPAVHKGRGLWSVTAHQL